MSLYVLVPLTACIGCAILATLILARDPADRSNRLASLMLCGAAWWAACEVLWNVQDDPRLVMALVKASALGWVWIGPLALDLFVQATGEPAGRMRRVLPPLYAASAAFLWIDWTTPWIHAGVVRTSWGWAYEFGFSYMAFYAYTVGCILLALRTGWRAHQSSASPAERQQARWLLVGIAVPLVVASLTDGLLPWAGHQPPRFGTASFAVLGAVIAWTFYRYGYSLLAPGAFAAEILETLPEGVALLRLDGCVRSANGAMTRLLAAPGRLTGLRLTELLCESPPDLGREVTEHACELVTFDARRVPVSVSSTILRDRQGSAIGLVLVARDLREVVSLRNRLYLSGRLAAVGELAAGIAHEISNPLAYVRANLGLLRRHWDALEGAVAKADDAGEAGELVAEGEELIDESLEGVERATAIVRDVRGLAHAGRGERELADLNGLLDGVLRMAAPQLRERGAVVAKRYGVLPPVSCAPQELQQVFLNLVINAGQALEGGGNVAVVTYADAHEVTVVVSDDGRGIPPELIDRIFDPFFTTKPVGEGTGLGLGIAHEIVRKHRGEIHVESEPGRGSTFRVRLPVHADTLAVA